MISLSEIDTTVKRATKAIGFSWGIAEEVGKCIRSLEMFGLPGIKNLNQYYKVFANKKFQNVFFHFFKVFLQQNFFFLQCRHIYSHYITP